MIYCRECEHCRADFTTREPQGPWTCPRCWKPTPTLAAIRLAIATGHEDEARTTYGDGRVDEVLTIDGWNVEAYRCCCPDDCNCHKPWATNYCGCKRHA